MLSHSMTTTLFALARVRTILITKCCVIDNHSFKKRTRRNHSKSLQYSSHSVHGAHHEFQTGMVKEVGRFCPGYTPQTSDEGLIKEGGGYNTVTACSC
jgi:hypothetical protein